MTKILMVDDETDLEILITQHFRRQIRAGEYEFLFAYNGYQALEKVKENPDLDIIVTDINMPEMDGLTPLDELKKVMPDMRAIVASAYGDMDNIRVAMNRGAFDFVMKPVNFTDLESTMKRGIENLMLTRQAAQTQSQLLSINQEIMVSAKLQQSILPKTFPNEDHLQLYGMMIPAKDIGGDFYDFFWLDDRHLGIVMADVSGKGLTAAFFMAVARTYLKGIAPYCYGPSEALHKLNQELSKENDTSMFVTTFYGILQTKTGEFIYSNGGHCPPALINAIGDVRFLPPTKGVAVGVFEEAVFEENIFYMEEGDTLFLYTDGVTEAMNEDFKEFGSDKLKDSLENTNIMDVKSLTEKAIEEVKIFAGQAPQSDDITCLSLRLSKIDP